MHCIVDPCDQWEVMAFLQNNDSPLNHNGRKFACWGCVWRQWNILTFNVRWGQTAFKGDMTSHFRPLWLSLFYTGTFSSQESGTNVVLFNTIQIHMLCLPTHCCQEETPGMHLEIKYRCWRSMALMCRSQQVIIWSYLFQDKCEKGLNRTIEDVHALLPQCIAYHILHGCLLSQ